VFEDAVSKHSPDFKRYCRIVAEIVREKNVYSDKFFCMPERCSAALNAVY